MLDRLRNPRYWLQTGPGRGEFRGWSTLQGAGAASDTRTIEPASFFLSNDKLDRGADSGSILVIPAIHARPPSESAVLAANRSGPWGVPRVEHSAGRGRGE